MLKSPIIIAALLLVSMVFRSGQISFVGWIYDFYNIIWWSINILQVHCFIQDICRIWVHPSVDCIIWVPSTLSFFINPYMCFLWPYLSHFIIFYIIKHYLVKSECPLRCLAKSESSTNKKAINPSNVSWTVHMRKMLMWRVLGISHVISRQYSWGCFVAYKLLIQISS